MASGGLDTYVRALGATAATLLLLIGAGTLVSPRRRFGGSLERLILRLAFGLAALPAALIALHELFRLRVRLSVACALGLVGLALFAREEVSRRRAASTATGRAEGTDRRSRDLALLLLAAGVAFACLKGALRFPGFEGHDPWGHALGIRYVMETGSLRQPFADWALLQYVDAYPPLFDVLMSIPCGLVGSIEAPLKAMNAAVAGLVIVVYYLLAWRLSGDRARALAATLFYVALPGNLTRHVWGHSVAVLLLFAGLYSAVRVRESWGWLAPGAVCFGGALLAAPSQGIVNFAFLAVTALVALGVSRAWSARLVTLFAGGLAISAIWFGGVVARYGTDPRHLASAMQAPELRRSGLTMTTNEAPSPFAGSEPRRYGLDDFLFFRPYANVVRWTGEKRMNDIVPEGIGVAVFLLAFAFSLRTLARRLRRREDVGWREIAFVWLLVALAGVLGPYFGVTFFTWRFWLVFCPMASLAAAAALLDLAELFPCARWARTAWGLVAAAVAVDVVMALHSDLTNPGPWRYLPANLPFLAVPLAAVLLALAERKALPAKRFAVTSILAVHFLVAGPARLRTLTHYVPPKGFYDAVEHAGILHVAEATAPGAPVYPLSDGFRAAFLVGLDRPSRPWEPEEHEFGLAHSRRDAPLPTEEMVRWLRRHGYRHLVLDPTYRRKSPSLFASRAEELQRSAGVRLLVHERDPEGGSSELLLFEIGP